MLAQVGTPEHGDDPRCSLTWSREASFVQTLEKLWHSHVLELLPQCIVSLQLQKFHLELWIDIICPHREGQQENFEVLGEAAYVLKSLFKCFLKTARSSEKIPQDF